MIMNFPILDNYFSFRGVIPRTPFWINGLLIVVIATLLKTYILNSHNVTVAISAFLIFLVLGFVLLSISVRRLHDAGYSGWWATLNYLGFIFGMYEYTDTGIEYLLYAGGAMVVVYLWCQPSKAAA